MYTYVYIVSVVVIIIGFYITNDHWPGQVNNEIFYETNNSGPSKQHFVVKIQLGLDSKREPILVERMVIYDKDHSFLFVLKKELNEAVHPRLEKIIIEKGVDGLKGFFHAIIVPSAIEKKETSKSLVKMEINIENILPREAW